MDACITREVLEKEKKNKKKSVNKLGTSDKQLAHYLTKLTLFTNKLVRVLNNVKFPYLM